MIRKIGLISKIYDVTAWSNNYNINTHISQCFMKQLQPDNEIWPVNRSTVIEKIFFKNRAENMAEGLVPDLFLFFKKVLYKLKASDLQLNYF